MLALAAKAIYTVYAPDMRGYGDSEVLSVDATGGMRDFSNDLNAFVQSLDLNPFHLLGWSLGGNIAMQYVIDHPGNVHSLTLESVSSPFGFGGTKDSVGTPTWPDFAGSGGGTANPHMRHTAGQASPQWRRDVGLPSDGGSLRSHARSSTAERGSCQ